MPSAPVKVIRLLGLMVRAADQEGVVTGLRRDDLQDTLGTSQHGLASMIHKLITCGSLERIRIAPGDGTVGTYRITARPYQAIVTHAVGHSARQGRKRSKPAPDEAGDEVQPPPRLSSGRRQRLREEYGIEVGETLMVQTLGWHGKRKYILNIPITLPAIPGLSERGAPL